MKSAIAQLLLGATALLTFAEPMRGVLAAPTAPAKTEQPKTEELPIVRPALVPAGVADGAGQTVYLRNLDGGIDAIEVANGKVKWTTKTIAKPLIAIPNRLVVPLPARLIVQVPVEGQANALKIAVWDSATGKELLLSDVLVFPDWVVVAAEDGAIYGKNFVSAVTAQGDELSLTWQASTHYAGGAAPPPEIEEAARNSAAGIFQVDLKTSRVKSEALPTINDKGEVIDIRPIEEQIPSNLVTVNGVTAMIWQNDAAKDPERKWTIAATADWETIGEVALGDNPENIKVVGSKIFWVKSTQTEVERMMPGEITRELNVAEIATGKTLWKRMLKPRQIMMFPA